MNSGMREEMHAAAAVEMRIGARSMRWSLCSGVSAGKDNRRVQTQV